MSFKKFCQKSPTKSSFKWSVSSSIKVNAGVPHESILELLLILIYINNLLNDLQSNPKLFADALLYFLPYKVSPQVLSF